MTDEENEPTPVYVISEEERDRLASVHEWELRVAGERRAAADASTAQWRAKVEAEQAERDKAKAEAAIITVRAEAERNETQTSYDRFVTRAIVATILLAIGTVCGTIAFVHRSSDDTDRRAIELCVDTPDPTGCLVEVSR